MTTLQKTYNLLEKDAIKYTYLHQISTIFKDIKDKYKRKKENQICQWETDIFNFTVRDFNTVYKPYHQTRQNATTLLSS